MTIAPTIVSSDAASATTFAHCFTNMTMTEATSGTAASTVTQGNPVDELISAHPHQKERCGDSERSDEQGKRIGAREPRLTPPQPSAGATDQGGEPVDSTVDPASVEVDESAGEVGTRSHEDVLVERIAVERAAGRPRHGGDVERLLDRHRLTGHQPPRRGDTTRNDEKSHERQYERRDRVCTDLDALADRWREEVLQR